MSGGIHVDLAYGGAGNDIINLGGGNDYAQGGCGADTIDGMEGDDRLYGGEGDDTISGYSGNDLIAGNGGNDKLYGRDGHDVLIGGLGADLMLGEAGNDFLVDGTLTYDPTGIQLAGTDASSTANDVHDAAMIQLLADWLANFDPDDDGSLSVTHDSDVDTLSGGAGTDTASPGLGDLGDWENTF
jgi:Ca2+-binding RTX toxin-like protein